MNEKKYKEKLLKLSTKYKEITYRINVLKKEQEEVYNKVLNLFHDFTQKNGQFSEVKK